MKNDNVFDDLYASYYDSLYQEKDYEAEVDYIQELWSAFGDEPPDSVLDLGCGTGGHGLLLADSGYSVTGVDQSPAMTQRAKQKIKQQDLSGEYVVETTELSSLDLDNKFDVATSLFSVMGYLTTVDEFLDSLRTIREHLKPGGVFIFDTWYGPAVWSQKPEKRFKEITMDDGMLYRYSEPELNLRRQTVSVEFDLIYVGENGETQKFSETHDVRFFFESEMRLFAEQTGFHLEDVHPFQQRDKNVGSDTWNVTWVFRNNEQITP